MKIIRCINCNEPLFEAEQNTIIVKTCPECKVQNKIKVQNRIKVESDNMVSYRKIS